MNQFKLPASDNLYCLSTSKKVSVEVRDDLVNCVAIGRTWCDEFKEECLRDEDRFQKPISRRKLKTFTSDAVKSKVKSNEKLKIMELTGSRDLLGRLLYLSAMSDLDLHKVFEYPLMPVPLSLANIDGAMHNPSKSKLARKIEDSVHSSTGPEDINVVMVDAFFFRTQTERHSTYGEVARCLLSKLVQMAPLVQLICDTYIHPSIKDPERMKRGDSSETVYSITGPNQNVPRDWQKALDSSSFQESFLRFLSTEWQRQEYGAILRQRQIYLALDHKCFRYTVRSGVIVREQVLALNSEHEEADTLIIYHLHKLTQEQPGLSISVRCDDTDVLLLLLYHVTCGNIQVRVWMDAGKVFNNTRRYINISQIIMEESNPSLFDALLGFQPDQNGWVLRNNMYVIDWFTGEQLPPSLCDLLVSDGNPSHDFEVDETEAETLAVWDSDDEEADEFGD